MFAMEISVAHDKRTGKSKVVSTATVTPEAVQDSGLKVYDDGRKSVYALHPDGSKMLNGEVGEMTPAELEELLHEATDQNITTELQYHQPVYSVPYTWSSRPPTPKMPNKIPQPTPTYILQRGNSSRNGAQIHGEENQDQDLEGLETLSKIPNPSFIQRESMSRSQNEANKLPNSHIAGQFNSDKHLILLPNFGEKTVGGLTNIKTDVNSTNPAAALSVKTRSEGIPVATQLVYKAVEGCSHKSGVNPDALIESSGHFNRRSPFCAESDTTLNLIKTLPELLKSEPVTMIFMGYENAESEEEEDIQAELVILGNSNDNDYNEFQYVKNESDECLSYHPKGYKSKVFQPKVGIAKVTGCSDMIEDASKNMDEIGLHKPTFIHKPGKHVQQAYGIDEHATTGRINMEKVKLCSTKRYEWKKQCSN